MNDLYYKITGNDDSVKAYIIKLYNIKHYGREF